MLPIDLIQGLRDKGRRLVVLPPDETGVAYVYAITHAHTPELAGLPALDVSRAQQQIEEVQHLAQRLAGCKSDKQRKRVEAEAEAVKERLSKALNDELWSTPERREAYLARCRAVVCAAVVAVGAAKEGVSYGPQPIGTHPESVCVELGQDGKGKPIYLQPLRILPERSSEPEPGTVCVLDFDPGEVMKLQMLFSVAFTVQHLVTPLPGAPGATREVPRAGGDVRLPSERVRAGPGSSGSGDRSGVRGRRKEG